MAVSIQEKDDDMCRLLSGGLSNGGSNNVVEIRRSFDQEFGNREGYHQLQELAYTRNDTNSHHFAVAFGVDAEDNGEPTTPVYVCFQSTQNMDHILTDLTAVAMPSMHDAVEGRVHRGFIRRAQRIPVEPFLRLLHGRSSNGKPYRLVFGGHSLGGAIAQLVALRVLLRCEEQEARRNVHVVTFGAPLVGDAKYTEQFEQQLGGADVAKRNCRFYVYGDDVVPRLLSMLVAPTGREFNADGPSTGKREHLVTRLYRAAREIWRAATGSREAARAVSRIAGVAREVIHWLIAAQYSAFGTYYKFDGGQWSGLTDQQRNELFRSCNLPRDIKVEHVKHHLFAHYKVNPRLSRGTWYQQRRVHPAPVSMPDFSAPDDVVFLPRSSTTSEWSRTVKYHLMLNGRGFAFVTSVTSSLDNHQRRHEVVILEEGDRVEFTISTPLSRTQRTIELRLNSVFGRAECMVNVVEFPLLRLSGNLAKVACLTRRELFNKAFLLTLLSMNEEDREDTLPVLSSLEGPELSHTAQQWIDKQRDELIRALQQFGDKERLRSIADKICFKVMASPFSKQEWEHHEGRFKPLHTVMQKYGRKLKDHINELSEACRAAFDLDEEAAKKLAQQLARAAAANKRADLTGLGSPPTQQCYREAARQFREGEVTADEAQSSIGRSTEQVVARSGFPDLQVEQGPIEDFLRSLRSLRSLPLGSRAVSVFFAAAAIASGAFWAVGLYAGVFAVLFGTSTIAGLSGWAAGYFLSVLLFTLAAVPLGALSANDDKYDENLQTLVRLLNLDPKPYPREPTLYRERYIVEHGIKKMEDTLGRRIQYEELATQRFCRTYWHANTGKACYPLKGVKNEGPARQRALQFLKDVWSIYKLRMILSKCFMIGVIGTMNTGKTTFLSRLRFNTRPNAHGHTESPELHRWPMVNRVLFLDFPGTDDVNQWVAEGLSLGAPMVDACIVVTDMRNTDSKGVKTVVTQLLRNKMPTLLCLNQCDRMLKLETEHGTDIVDSDDDDDADDDNDNHSPSTITTVTVTALFTILRWLGLISENVQTDTQTDTQFVSRDQLWQTAHEKVSAMMRRHVTLKGNGDKPQIQRFDEIEELSLCLTTFAKSDQWPGEVKRKHLRERGVIRSTDVLKDWIFPLLEEEVNFDAEEQRNVLDYLRPR